MHALSPGPGWAWRVFLRAFANGQYDAVILLDIASQPDAWHHHFEDGCSRLVQALEWYIDGHMFDFGVYFC